MATYESKQDTDHQLQIANICAEKWGLKYIPAKKMEKIDGCFVDAQSVVRYIVEIKDRKEHKFSDFPDITIDHVKIASGIYYSILTNAKFRVIWRWACGTICYYQYERGHVFTMRVQTCKDVRDPGDVDDRVVAIPKSYIVKVI